MYNRRYFNAIGFVPFFLPDTFSMESAGEYIGELGAKGIRLWFQFRYILEAPDRINRKNADFIHSVIAELRRRGVKQIIGDNHDWFIPDGEGKPVCRCGHMPHRETGAYSTVLDWFEESWRTVAREFDEVDGWETGNEANHVPFLNALDGEEFDLMQKADICTDMMFRAARAIRGVTTGKLIIMPGMAPVGGDHKDPKYPDAVTADYDGMTMSLERIYRNIESGKFGSANPRDFFDKLCWHPYYLVKDENDDWKCPDDKWVELNKAVYAVAQAHGDGDIGCYFSEYGIEDGDNIEKEKKYADYIVEGMRRAKADMPFVESIQVFRIFSFLNTGEYDTYSLCDGRVIPPRKKEKFEKLMEFYKK